MDNSIFENSKERLSKHRRHRRWLSFLCVLAALVLIGTVISQIRPAMAASEPLELRDVTTSGNGTVYNAKTQTYSVTDLRIDFTILTNPEIAQYYFNYDASIIVPEELLGKHYDLKDDSGDIVGDYIFSQNADGSYQVLASLSEAYLENAGETINGFIAFDGEIKSGVENERGEIVVRFTDEFSLIIPASDINYPTNTTSKYDLHAQKYGSYAKDSNQLVYMVNIYSYKGTPDAVEVSDVLSLTKQGFDLTGIKVETVDFNQYSWSAEPGDAANAGTVFELSGAEAQKGSSASSKYGYSYEDGTITMQLPGLDAGKKNNTYNGNTCDTWYGYRLTYTYTLANDGTITDTALNKVRVSATDETNGKLIYEEEQTRIKIEKSYTISKSGSYNSTTGRITWTIVVNKDQCNISGALVEDDMFASISGEPTVQPSDGYTWVTDDSGRRTGMRFANASGKDYNAETYTITYDTLPDESWPDPETNTAYFYPDGNHGGSGGISDSSTVKGDIDEGTVNKRVSKAQENADQTITIDWAASIVLPSNGLLPNTVITDDMTEWPSRTHYMTYESIQNTGWMMAVGSGSGYLAKLGNLEFKLTNNEWYTWAQVQANQTLTSWPYWGKGLQEVPFVGFRVTVQERVTADDVTDNRIDLSYQTFADISDAELGANYYKNTITVNNKKGEATYTYTKGGVVKKDGNGQTGQTSLSNEDGVLKWIVTATTDASDYKKLTLTDTLPEGIELTTLSFRYAATNTAFDLAVSESGKITTPSGSGDGTYKITGTYDKKTGKIVTRLTLASGDALPQAASFDFIYSCRISDATMERIVAGEQYTFRNSVTMKTDEKEFDGTTQTQVWTKKVPVENEIEKSGVWDPDNQRITYSVIVNESASDLIADSSMLTVRDQMKYYSAEGQIRELSLMPSSVKLYEASYDSASGTYVKGAQLTDGWSWTYGFEEAWGWNTHTLTFSVPDEKTLILEYMYSVDTIKYAWGNGNLGVTNTASILETKYESSDTGSDWTWTEKSSSTTGEVNTTHSFTLYKVEKGDYGTALPGAEFTLYRYSGGKYKETGTVYTTDEKGMIRIREKDEAYSYQKNVLYMLKETKAPDGYMIPEEVPAFCFYFSGTSDTSNTLPSELPSGAADITAKNAVRYAENEKNSTTIRVDKQWFDPAGINVTEKTKGAIYFDLYRQENYESEGSLKRSDTEASVIGTYSVSADDGWTWESDTLAKYGKDSSGRQVVYTYYVEEKPVTNYETAYEDNAGIESGTIIIRNTQTVVPQYELPATGGPGLRMYAWAGMLFILVAFLLLYISLRRRES